MYDHALPVARGVTPRANQANATPYRSQLATVLAVAIQIARGGTRGTVIARPVARAASATSRGIANGASASAAAPTMAIPTTASSDRWLPSPAVSRPTASAILPPAVAAITAKPAMMLTRFTTRLDPIAAVAETPLRFAMAPMAAICHTRPGMYFPRFDTNQMRAASGNAID